MEALSEARKTESQEDKKDKNAGCITAVNFKIFLYCYSPLPTHHSPVQECDARKVS
jgi:hypothetical protein